MFIELVDALCCPQSHERSSLVAAVDRAVERSVRAGTLGCPVCHRRYPVVDGTVVFDEGARARAGERPDPPGDEGRPNARPGPPAGAAPDSPWRAERVAALLDLTTPNGLVLLHGRWAVVAEPLQRLTEVWIVSLNPPGVPFVGGAVTPLYATVAPFMAGALRGAALDASADARLVASVTGALSSGARLVGPPALSVPAGVRLLARDSAGWVGEVVGTDSPAAPVRPVTLRRGGGSQSSP